MTCPARASVVGVDFNDDNPGQLSGQGGGTGLTGTWAGSANPQVVAGDLSAPASTNYSLAQSSGTPQSLQGAAKSTNTSGQVTRAASTSLSGTVWFSLLVNPIDANARGGLSFNASGSGANGSRIDAVGQNLFVSYGTGPTINGVLTTGSTHLLVGEVIVNEGGGTADHLRLWVDPDVSTLTDSTTTHQVFDSGSSDWVGDAIATLGLQSYGSGADTSLGALVDAVRISDGPNAAADVGVGVPEPASLSTFGIIGGIALMRRRRR